MKFSIRFADQIVGALVILALAILVVVVFMLGKTQRWFVHDYEYMTYLNSASGVSRNMPVQYRGFRIGDVKKFELVGDRVEIYFTIYKEHGYRVKEGSLVEMQNSPIGLGSSFLFYPGLGLQLIPEGSVIPEITAPEAKFYIAEGYSDIPKQSDSINNIVNSVNTILDSISASLLGSEGSENLPIAQLLNDASAAIRSIQTAVDNLDPLIKQVSSPSGTVMSVLDGQGKFYKGVEGAIGELVGILEDLNKTTDFLPENLPQVVILINELNTAIRTLQDVLTAISNNPLLKGGIPEKIETGPGGAGSRNLNF